jgi:hypothetical protein
METIMTGYMPYVVMFGQLSTSDWLEVCLAKTQLPVGRVYFQLD